MKDPLQYWPSMWPKGERPSGKGRFMTADGEGMGLTRQMNNPDDIHIFTLKDYYSGEKFIFFDPIAKRQNPTPVEMEGDQDGYIEDAVRMLMECESFCFQNGVGYDMHVFERCFPHLWKDKNYHARRRGMPHSDLWPCKLMDTMILSQLLYPDRPLDGSAYALGMGNIGSHSIKAHGLRMGRPKPEHEDWTTLTDDMIHRNVEDVEIGEDMFKYLMLGDWKKHTARGANPRTKLGIVDAYTQELQFAVMMHRQEIRGFRLDMKQAYSDWQAIGKEMDVILDEVEPLIPPKLETEPLKMVELKGKFAKCLKAHDDGLLNGIRLSSVTPEGMPLIGEELARYAFNQIAGSFKRGDLDRTGKRATMWSLATKSGDYSKNLQKYYPEMRGNINDTKDPLVGGAFTPIVFEKVSLGNLAYVKENVLYPMGWRGVNYSDSEEDFFSENGEHKYPWSGKIDEDSVKAWKARTESAGQHLPDWAEKIASYYVLRSRRSQILNPTDVEYYDANGFWPKQASMSRGLMGCAYSKEYGCTASEYYMKYKEWPSDPDEEWRVPALAFSIGTNTFRCRHKFVVNIPARGLWPLRHLFIAGKGKLILGCDGAGLELRMLAHFMADAIYQEIILNGDIHSHNQSAAGLPTRDMAKTFIYAFLYGSGIAGLASLTGMSLGAMQDCIDKFKRELPALSNLIERCEEQGRRYGYFLSVDGRWGRIRKSNRKLLIHTVLNVLLQMTGSICMKYGACLAETHMIDEGVALGPDGFPQWVANVHDEVQLEVDENEVEEMHYDLFYVEPPKPTDATGGSDEYKKSLKKAIKSVWDAEEKLEYIDAEGRMWSAPSKLSAADGRILVRRVYHRAGHIIAASFTEAGELLKIRTPLAGEYKIGHSWHDTH